MRLTSMAVCVAVSLSIATSAGAQEVGADGSLGYSYSFPLPPARGRYQPVLSLSYNSNGGMSAAGLGWSLSENYVEVTTRASPVLNGQPRARYFLARNGAKQLIMPASDGSYRPDVSDTYFKLTKSANSWTAVDAVGNTYSYSCLPGQPNCTRWYLIQVLDVDQNKTVYDYGLQEEQECRNPDGVVVPNRTAGLLTSIAYNYNSSGTPIHSVSLGYTPAPATGPRRSVEALGQCLVTHNYRLTAVVVTRIQPPGSPASAVTVAQYDVAQKLSTDTGHWLLDRIQLRDRVGNAVGLATSFNYESDLPNIPQDDGSPTTPLASLAPLGPPTMVQYDVGLATNPLMWPTVDQCKEWSGGFWVQTNCGAYTIATWIDMDGDGLPDMVWGGYDDAAPASSGIRWARNITRPQGGGQIKFAKEEIIQGSQTWKGYVSFTNSAGSKEVLENSSTVNQNWRFGVSRLIDINGDGLPDLVLSGRDVLQTECNLFPAGYISIRFARIDAGGKLVFDPYICASAAVPWSNGFGPYYNAGPIWSAADGTMPLTYRLLQPLSQASLSMVELVDMTGDGLPDFVVVVGTEWRIYPGHATANGAWSFGTDDAAAPYVKFTPLTPSAYNEQMTSQIPTSQMSIRQTNSAAQTVVTLEDVTGDGLPDRIVVSPTNATWPAAQYQWTIDYNTGASFASTHSTWYQGALPPGFPTKDNPYPGDIGSDVMLLDLNKDGRPEFLFAGGGMTVRFNEGGGHISPAILPSPDEYTPSGRDFRPFGVYAGAGWNEMFVDLDGDGTLDYVHSGCYAGTGQTCSGFWTLFRGQQHQRRSDLLISMTSSTGATTTVQWGPSSDYGVVQHVPRVSNVVTSLSVSGPALPPLTTSYVYSNAIYTIAPDDPAHVEVEALGFRDQYQLPSVGGLVRHVRYGTSNLDGGMPLLIEVSQTNGRTPPTYTAVVMQENTWSARQVGAADCAAFTYPAFRYVARTQNSRSEGEVTFTSAVDNTCPDANGNIKKTTVTPDIATSAPFIVNREFSSVDACVSCVLEEWATASPPGEDLFHRYYHYDLSVFTPESGHGTSLTKGRLSYVEHLVTGSGPAGTYERSPIVLYTAEGLPSDVRTSYSGQSIDSVTKTYEYDSFSRLEMKRETVSDNIVGSTILRTAYKWSAHGDLIQRTGPAKIDNVNAVDPTTATGPVTGWAYDAVGRMTAVAAAAITGDTVPNPVVALEYVQATTQSPGARKMYTFSWTSDPANSYSLAAGVPNTDDVVQVIEYFDAYGRPIQTRTRLGDLNPISVPVFMPVQRIL